MRRAAVVGLSAIVVTVACASCAVVRPQAPDREKIVAMKNEKLNDTFWLYTNVPPEHIDASERKAARALMVDEMARRRMLPPLSLEEIDLIRKQQLKVGMSRTALVHAWGHPDGAERAQLASGRLVEHFVYSRGVRYSDTVHLHDGRVTSWELRQ